MHPAALISEFLDTPWALKQDRVRIAASILVRYHAAGALSTVPEATAGDRPRPSAARARAGAVAVLPVYGIVSQRGGSLFDALFGAAGVSTQWISRALQEALADDTIGAILLDIDSPGGSVYGVDELADEIYAARTRKPIVAFANSVAASAAYWMASSATELYVTPGGEVGSIGVWSAHQDLSKLFDEVGIKMTLVAAGKFKTEGNPYEPLSSEARDFMQSRVNDYYGTFTRAVARNRGTSVAKVRDGMGQGRTLGATAAKSENMVDGVGTFKDALSRATQLLRPAGSPPRASAVSLAGPASSPERRMDAVDRVKASPRELRERDL